MAATAPNIFALVDQLDAESDWPAKTAHLKTLMLIMEREPLDRMRALAAGITPILLDGLESTAKECAEFRQTAIKALVLLAQHHVNARSEIVKHKGIETLAMSIKRAPSEDPDLGRYLYIFAQACNSTEAQNIALKKGLMSHIMSLLESDDSVMITLAAQALIALTKNNISAKNKAVDEGAIELLMQILQNPDYQLCHQITFLALDTLVLDHRYACSEFLTVEKPEIAAILPHIAPYAPKDAMLFYTEAAREEAPTAGAPVSDAMSSTPQT